MSYQTDLVAGFNDAQAVLGGVTATIGASTFDVIVADATAMLTLVPGGFLDEFKFGFQCLGSEWPGLPVDRRVTVDGITYRILLVVDQESNDLVNVFCGGINQ